MPKEIIYNGNKIIAYSDGTFLSTKLVGGEVATKDCRSLDEAKAFIRKPASTKTVSVWLRVGAEIKATPSELKKIISGNTSKLEEVIRRRGLTLSGESYIPAPVKERLARENSIPTDDDNDVDFFLTGELELSEKTNQS